eukprot:TRINITY_DN857_c0_g2_i1.p1 TRINITY_DN857_c0_g2~~TRINITY_DN857_c0_g2_i1.p1  ORF type:complete len:244 (+),score=98.93 TRINITY_DN857_c0_g2_i1:119-850(+)
MASKITFKLEYKGQIRKFIIPKPTLAKFAELLPSVFLENCNYRLSYVDSDGDKITVTSEVEWETVLEEFKHLPAVRLTLEEIPKPVEENLKPIPKQEIVVNSRSVEEEKRIAEEEQRREEERKRAEKEQEEERKRLEEERLREEEEEERRRLERLEEEARWKEQQEEANRKAEEFLLRARQEAEKQKARVREELEKKEMENICRRFPVQVKTLTEMGFSVTRDLLERLDAVDGQLHLFLETGF